MRVEHLIMISISLIILLVVESVYSFENHASSRLEESLKSDCELRKLYDEYKETHAHTRPPHEERMRMKLFMKELEVIVELRRNPDITWGVGINFMADMTAAEQDLMKSTNVSTTWMESDDLKLKAINKGYKMPIKSAYWITERTMGPIRKQLKGDGWAHAASATIEAQLTGRSGKYHRLSTQEIYDCAYDPQYNSLPLSYRKNGNPQSALKYVEKSQHLGYELDSPSTGAERGFKCSVYSRRLNGLQGYKIQKVQWLFEKSDESLRYHLHYISPIAVAIETTASNLMRLKEGTFKASPDCLDHKPDHTMVVVAYDQYTYTLRNSWGTEWGDQGYMWWDREGPSCHVLDTMVIPYLEEENADWEWPRPYSWHKLPWTSQGKTIY